MVNVPRNHPAETILWGMRVRVQCLWRGDRERARAYAEELAGLLFPMQGIYVAALDTLLSGSISPQFVRVLDGQAKGAGSSARMRALYRQHKAEIAASVGATEEMLGALEAADEAGLLDLAWIENCPLFDAVRGEARMKRVRDSVAARAGAVLAELDAALTPQLEDTMRVDFLRREVG